MADFITFLIREGLRSIEGIIGTMAAMVTIVSPFIKVRDQKKASYKKMRKAIQIIAVSVFVVSVVLLVLTYIGSVVVEQVALDHSNLTLKAGDTETLSATVLYSNNRTDNRVVWTTSNEAVASVDENGVVIAIAPGTTVITAQASKNNTAESAVCTITVCSEPTGYSIALSADSVCMQETFYVHITPYEDDITEIHVIARSPSGQEFDRLFSEKGYIIDTETGVWTIYASVRNMAGVYVGQKPEDFATIEVTDPFEMLNLLQQYE